MSPDRSGVYYPEELSLLGQVLNQAVESLPTIMRTPGNRAEIARNILACAATGERDPIELARAALTNLKNHCCDLIGNMIQKVCSCTPLRCASRLSNPCINGLADVTSAHSSEGKPRRPTAPGLPFCPL